MSNDICGIVLDTTSDFAPSKHIKILGKTSLDWVKVSLAHHLVGVVQFDNNSDLLDKIKPLINITCKYTVVLYGDTPLITQDTIDQAITLISNTGISVIKLVRGWVFDTKYLITIDTMPVLTTTSFGEQDFAILNSYSQLASITNIIRHRILEYHMDNGIYIVDPNTTWIDCEVVIGQHTIIQQGNIIKNQTEIKSKVTLLPGNTIDNCIIDSGAVIHNSVLHDSYVGCGSSIGPYARLRPDSVIGNNCKIGNFVEIKKSLIGDNTKVAHHVYIGDSQVGPNCNFGCGVVVANYDGVNKRVTNIGNRVFVGANSTLIAPITIQDDAFVAAGSTLTDDVEAGNLAVARARQINKSNWVNPTYK
jgi:bifunctional N-acetylglucosamine-1-phosphate-uridyltransferase/glucosamine-1-phosphate-acetyltransferase GlmU-like protein